MLADVLANWELFLYEEAGEGNRKPVNQLTTEEPRGCPYLQQINCMDVICIAMCGGGGGDMIGEKVTFPFNLASYIKITITCR